MEPYIILKGLVGSRLYGFATEESDYDYRGVFVAPTEEMLSLRKPKDTLVCHEGGFVAAGAGDADVTVYEVEKFIRLAAGANPTILELLFLPDYEILEPEGQLLVRFREAFLSNRVRETYGGYVHQQVRKLRAHEGDYFESKVRNRYAKHARHIVRLLDQGIQLVETGELDPVVGEEKRELLYSMGDQTLEFIEQYVEDKIRQMDHGKSCLTDEPDYDKINGVLLSIRRNN